MLIVAGVSCCPSVRVAQEKLCGLIRVIAVSFMSSVFIVLFRLIWTVEGNFLIGEEKIIKARDFCVGMPAGCLNGISQKKIKDFFVIGLRIALPLLFI